MSDLPSDGAPMKAAGSSDAPVHPTMVTFTYSGTQATSIVRALFSTQRSHFASHGHAKRLVARGRACIDGQTASLGNLVEPGQTITFRPSHEVLQADTSISSGPRRRIVYYERLDVRFECDEWAAVVKPPGLAMDTSAAVQWKTNGSLRSFASALPYNLQPSSLLDDALPVPQAVHRLDTPVGGLVLVAKTRMAVRELSALLRARRVRKTYTALVAGKPEPPRGRIDMPVQGKPSLTSYRVLATQSSVRFGAVSTVELQPHTGRLHQLRVHCATALHCPIIGDELHGGERVSASQALYLWARRLELPVDEEEAIPHDAAGEDCQDEHALEGLDTEGEEARDRDEEPTHQEGSACPPDSADGGHHLNVGKVAESPATSGGGTMQLHTPLVGTFEVVPPNKFGKFLLRDRRAWDFATKEGAVVSSPWLSAMIAENAELQAMARLAVDVQVDHACDDGHTL